MLERIFVEAEMSEVSGLNCLTKSLHVQQEARPLSHHSHLTDTRRRHLMVDHDSELNTRA